jgi:hypothetical protein
MSAAATLEGVRDAVIETTRPCVAIGCTSCPRHRILAALESYAVRAKMRGETTTTEDA